MDNGEIVKKLLLRRRFTEELPRANVYVAGCGRGQMLGAVWLDKSDYILAIDRDPHKTAYVRYHYPQVDARLADFNRFADWPDQVRFQIADFDPYGDPYGAIDNFFRQPCWQTPLFAVVTDGVPLWLGRGGFLPQPLRSEATPRRLGDPHLRMTYFETVVWPWWHDRAHEYGLRVIRTALLWKKGRTVAYYAVHLDQ